MNFDLILFDCDGTLVDSEYMNNLATLQLLAEEGITQYDMEYAFAYFVGLRLKNILANITQETGYVFPDNMSDRYVAKAERLMPEYLKIIPGAAELISFAKDKTKICVASNGQRDNVLSSLDMTGLRQFFPDEHVFTGVQVANPKPAPDLFLLAAERMGAQPSRCLVIEDSVPGVTAGVAAGMQVFGFTGAHRDTERYGNKLSQAGAHKIYGSLIHIAQDLRS